MCLQLNRLAICMLLWLRIDPERQTRVCMYDYIAVCTRTLVCVSHTWPVVVHAFANSGANLHITCSLTGDTREVCRQFLWSNFALFGGRHFNRLIYAAETFVRKSEFAHEMIQHQVMQWLQANSTNAMCTQVPIMEGDIRLSIITPEQALKCVDLGLMAAQEAGGRPCTNADLGCGSSSLLVPTSILLFLAINMLVVFGFAFVKDRIYKRVRPTEYNEAVQVCHDTHVTHFDHTLSANATLAM